MYPLKDIRKAIADALDGCKDAAVGTFFSSRSFSPNKAPNPMLEIKGFGVLGIPLSEPEAKRLASARMTRQAPFGMGERTVINKTVRDTWEVDGSKIQFLNSAGWDTWMNEEVVPYICDTLGVNVAESAPEVQLYKLLLYQTGSHFLPHQDTEKTPGMFATVVIVLPSEFTGGTVHLSHAGKTQTIDIAANSTSMTHALAWYTDVVHSVHPVTSGYRLALSYNLVHSRSRKVTLRAALEGADALRHALSSWKLAKEGRLRLQGRDIPDQLCYILDHEYSQINLQTRTFKGSDITLIRRIAPVAAELNIGLFFANVKVVRRGEADDPHGMNSGGEWPCGNSDASDMEFGDEDTEDSWEVKFIVNSDGKPVVATSQGIDEKDVIPEWAASINDDDKPDEKDYEGYMGNGPGALEFWYHRSALILCPDKNRFKSRKPTGKSSRKG